MGKSGEKRKRNIFKRDKSQKKDLLHQNDAEAGRETEEHHTGEFVPPDGGWGWVVCIASLWANGTVFGIINTFGIIYVQMRDYYAKDNPEVSLKTAFVGSVCTGVTFLMCTTSSILSDRVGIRPTAFVGAIIATTGLVVSAFIEQMEILYLTFGVLLGVGSSMVYSPSLVILGHYFKVHMGLVNGIVAFGSSIFTIALTRILPELLSTIGIKYTFLFLAGLHFMMVIFSLSWKPIFKKEDHLAALTLSTESVYQHCENCCTWTKRFLNVKIWRNKGYVVWIASLGVALFGYFVPFFHLPKHTQDVFPDHDGSWLILCLSITSGVSRIIFGKLADFPWVSRIRLQQVAFVVLGISTLCIPFSASFGGLIAISLVMGLCDGIFVCLLGPIAFDLVGPLHASQAIGFLLGVFSVPFTIGPPVAGWLYDYMGNYKIAFHAAGAPPILGAIIMFFIPKLEQNYPAATETQTFASISMLDVFNEIKVPAPDKSCSNGVKSGPSTEIELIQSSELLYLGKGRKNPEKEPMLQDVETEGESSTTADLEPARQKPSSSQIQLEVQEPRSESTSRPNVPDSHLSSNTPVQDSKGDSDQDSQESGYDNEIDYNTTSNSVIDNNTTDKAQANTQPVSTSLLDEVSKYLDGIAKE